MELNNNDYYTNIIILDDDYVTNNIINNTFYSNTPYLNLDIMKNSNNEGILKIFELYYLSYNKYEINNYNVSISILNYELFFSFDSKTIEKFKLNLYSNVKYSINHLLNKERIKFDFLQFLINKYIEHKKLGVIYMYPKYVEKQNKENIVFYIEEIDDIIIFQYEKTGKKSYMSINDFNDLYEKLED